VTLVPGGPNGYVYFPTASPALDLQIAYRGTVRDGGGFREAFMDAGLTREAAAEVTDLLSSQIDFLSDVRAGDSFQLLYRSVWEEERLLDEPVLIMLSVVNRDRKLEFFRGDARRGGGGEFYDSEFRSIRKPILASPLQYSGVARAIPDHGGAAVAKEELPGAVRYLAPQGVPVAAVASGTVRYAGRRAAYGNLVVVTHDDHGYETYYSHLSGFAPGVSPGARVEKGQPLGKVGMSGATLSPVLDYSLCRAGSCMEPSLALSEIRGDMLDDALRADFAELVGKRRIALRNLLAPELL
jgi:murein DD-endopeptidase MepM/ murein hydrolase activator NlpD